MEKGPFPISIQKYKLLWKCLQKASNVGYNIILNKEGLLYIIVYYSLDTFKIKLSKSNDTDKSHTLLRNLKGF